MKAILFNGSPRRDQNTAQLLNRCMEGITDAGVSAELVDLYDYTYTGCRSCFACKLKGSTANGVCAVRDEARPLLEQAHEADIVVFGTPVYYGMPAGQLRSFIERYLFPIDTYVRDENGVRVRILNKIVPTAVIYTMNIPDERFEELHYPTLLGSTGEALDRVCGYCENLYVTDTYQFEDYSRYRINVFSGEAKKLRREQHFPLDLEEAYRLGKRLVGTAADRNP